MKTHQITINKTKFVITESLGVVTMNVIPLETPIEMTKAECVTLSYILAVLGKPDLKA